MEDTDLFPIAYNEKLTRPSHNEQLSKYISLVDIIPVVGNDSVITTLTMHNTGF